MEDEYRGSTSSINYDILSVGIADAQPIAKHHASLIDNAGHNEMEQHILPSPNFSRPSPRRPISTGTIEDLRRPQLKRRSIIDPATVRLSFTGSISDVSSPLALPLEEGLQKLYKLYNEYTKPTAPLPHTLSITDVPLSTIADALSNHIRAQSAALLDCAQNLHNMTNLHEKLKQDLITLEQHYSLAVEKGNIAAMSTEDVRRRLGWQIEEIIRINTEKELAINEAAYHKNEAQRLSTELQGMAEILQENAKLKDDNQRTEEEAETLKVELEEAKVELKEVKQKLENVPKQITKLYGKWSDNGKERKRLERRNGKVRTGLLIPASPDMNGIYP